MNTLYTNKIDISSDIEECNQNIETLNTKINRLNMEIETIQSTDSRDWLIKQAEIGNAFLTIALNKAYINTLLGVYSTKH